MCQQDQTVPTAERRSVIISSLENNISFMRVPLIFNFSRARRIEKGMQMVKKLVSSSFGNIHFQLCRVKNKVYLGNTFVCRLHSQRVD